MLLYASWYQHVFPQFCIWGSLSIIRLDKIHYHAFKNARSREMSFLKETVYANCKAHSWSWFNFNFICIHICWLHAVKTGRFLRVWGFSILDYLADVVNTNREGKRVQSSFLSSSVGGKKKREAKERALPCANLGTVSLNKRIRKWKCVPLKWL